MTKSGKMIVRHEKVSRQKDRPTLLTKVPVFIHRASTDRVRGTVSDRTVGTVPATWVRYPAAQAETETATSRPPSQLLSTSFRPPSRISWVAPQVCYGYRPSRSRKVWRGDEGTTCLNFYCLAPKTEGETIRKNKPNKCGETPTHRR